MKREKKDSQRKFILGHSHPKKLSASTPRWTGLQNRKQAESLLTPRSSRQCSPTSQVVHRHTHAHHRESHHSANRRSNSDDHVFLQYSIRLVDVHHQSSIQHNMQQKCRTFAERYTLLHFNALTFFLFLYLPTYLSHLFIDFYLCIYVIMWMFVSCVCLQSRFYANKTISRNTLGFISHHYSFLENFPPRLQ